MQQSVSVALMIILIFLLIIKPVAYQEGELERLRESMCKGCATKN